MGHLRTWSSQGHRALCKVAKLCVRPLHSASSLLPIGFKQWQVRGYWRARADSVSLSFLHNLPESGLIPHCDTFFFKLKNKTKQTTPEPHPCKKEKKKIEKANVFAYCPG